MKYIDDMPQEYWRGKRVLLRSDFNVPLGASGEVAGAFRLTRGWASVQYLAERGARVVVVSHMGEPEESLAPVARALESLGRVLFVPDVAGPLTAEAASAMQNGDVILLENLRRDPGEKKNDGAFAEKLASLCDAYVDDAFSAAHRPHASIIGVPRLRQSFAGLLMREEIEQLDRARAPQGPSFAILGGAKFETKAPLISSLLSAYDHLFLAGALANDVFKAKGFPVGVSLISKELPARDVLENPRFVSPVDVTVERADKQAKVKKPESVAADEKIVDIGPDSVATIAPFIEEAKFILWNGPTGLYEAGYVTWTSAIGELVAKAIARGATAVIGGGDTIAALQESGIPEDKLGFLSTGGGAMLEYLLKGTLPGIEALN
jgi:phosphoglycerate kinase